MTKFAKKHLSRCVGLYLVGAVALGAGMAVYDMPSAYAFSDSAYQSINKNINRDNILGLSVGAYDTAKQEYEVTITREGGEKSILYMTQAQLGDGKLDLGKLEFDQRNDALNIDIPSDMQLTASGTLDNGANSPLNIKSDAKLTLEGDTTISGKIDVAAGKTLTVAADPDVGNVKLTGNDTIANNGKIVTEGADIKASIENKGQIDAGTGTKIEGTITNAGMISATGATIAGTVTNQGSLSLSGATVDGTITGEKGTVAVSGAVTGAGKIEAGSVKITENADLSGISNVTATHVEVADGKTVDLGANVKADTVKINGTGEGVTGSVNAGTVNVSESYDATKSGLELKTNANEAVNIVVDTKDSDTASAIATQVAGSIKANGNEGVKVVVSTKDGASNEITLETDASGKVTVDSVKDLEDKLANDKFENDPIKPVDPSGGLTPDQATLVAKAQSKAAYDVFAKDAKAQFITNEDLKNLQEIDAKLGNTTYYKDAMRNLQKVASPTVATRQSMQLLNGVSLGNVSDRLDSIRTARGHVGVYPAKDNVKGAMDDKTGNLWASIKHGDTDIDGDDVANVKYNYYQIGYDHQVGDSTYIGAFVGTTTGDVTVNGMKSDIDSAWDFGLYGTRLLPQGQYFNLVGKYGKMTNKFRTAEWDNKGYNVALEYGQKVQQPAGFTITPYVQLVYDHASDSTVSGVYVPMALDSSDAWSAKIGAKFENEDAHGNNIYGGIAYSKGIGGSYSSMVNDIRLPDVDNDLGVIFVNLGVQHKLSDSSYFDLRVEKEMLDYDGWNVQGVVNFAF